MEDHARPLLDHVTRRGAGGDEVGSQPVDHGAQQVVVSISTSGCLCVPRAMRLNEMSTRPVFETTFFT